MINLSLDTDKPNNSIFKTSEKLPNTVTMSKSRAEYSAKHFAKNSYQDSLSKATPQAQTPPSIPHCICEMPRGHCESSSANKCKNPPGQTRARTVETPKTQAPRRSVCNNNPSVSVSLSPPTRRRALKIPVITGRQPGAFRLHLRLAGGANPPPRARRIAARPIAIFIACSRCIRGMT